MTQLTTVFLLLSAVVLKSNAWTVQGTVLCDADQDGVVSTADTPLANVLVVVTNLSGTYSNASLTASDGTYSLQLQPFADFYVEYLQGSTLPASPVLVSPPTGTWTFSSAPTQQDVTAGFLVSSPVCAISLPVNACSLSGNATIRSGKGRPIHSFGGSINSDCAGAIGGNWSDTDHARNLQFKSSSITSVRCVTPIQGANYIEFAGTGTLRGTGGKKVNYGAVLFTARVDDQSYFNREADLYYLRVYDETGTLVLVSGDSNDLGNISPVPIASGDLKLQITACEQ